MSKRSSSETLDHYTSVMGNELGQIFDALFQEVAWLHVVWAEYRALFGENQTRIDLLNKAAPHFFGIVQTELYDNVLLRIARLTDSSRSLGKQNLTIQRLPELISDAAALKRVKEAIEYAIQQSEFCRDWRNRRLAHQDLDLALERSSVPLQAASRLQVRNALAAIEMVISAVGEHYEDSTYSFDVRTAHGGSEALLPILSAGIRARDERQKRLEEGAFLPEDLTANAF